MGHNGTREEYLARLNRPTWKKVIDFLVAFCILLVIAIWFAYGVIWTVEDLARILREMK